MSKEKLSYDPNTDIAEQVKREKKVLAVGREVLKDQYQQKINSNDLDADEKIGIQNKIDSLEY